MRRRSADAQRRMAHSFVGPVITQIFEELDVGASVWDGGRWRGIHWQTELLEFELEHRAEARRKRYNARTLGQVQRRGEAVLGELDGLYDLFTPVCVDGRVTAVVVVGPFATARPTGTEIAERWKALTGRQGQLAVPEFGRYVEASEAVLVLEGPRLADFRRLVDCLAEAMAGGRGGSAAQLLSEVERLRPRLTAARTVERIWSAAHSIVDERTSRVWASPVRSDQRLELGLSRFPEVVAVGLFVNPFANPKAALDPLDELLRRRALQRRCAEAARGAGNALSGRVGDHGVTFLCGASEARAGGASGAGGSLSRARARARLVDLIERCAALARRQYGIAVHFGVSALAVSIAEQYHAALAAAESALSGGLRIAHAEVPPDRGGAFDAVSRALREVAELAEKTPRAMPARFDRFLELVAVRSGHRLEVARAHAETAFERIGDEIVDSGALDERGLADIRSTVATNAAAAVTIAELFAIYRAGLRDVLAAIERPVVARRDRGLRRAEEYLRRNYAAPFDFARVARVAGFAPSYFSTLFRRKQGMTVEQYLASLRLNRARELLATTELSVDRVARLSGFSSGHYLARVFKRATRQTPLAYRKDFSVVRAK